MRGLTLLPAVALDPALALLVPAASVVAAAGTVAELGSRFTLVFVSVLLLTVALVALHVVLAVRLPQPTQAQAQLIDRIQWAWGSGFVALLGLVGGKAL